VSSFEDLIRQAEESVQYGTVMLVLKRKDDNTTTIDLTKVTQHNVASNAEALTIVGTMLKMLAQAGESGNLTFTITLDKGHSKQLLMNDFKRFNRVNGEYQ